MSETTETQTPPAKTGPAGTAEDPIPLKQMTQKSLVPDPKAVRKMPKGSFLKLGVYFGTIEGIKFVESKFSDELNPVFIGEFRAIHPTTGQFYASEKSYWFKAMSAKLQATFESGGGKPVEFAYEIMAAEQEDAQLGYEYVAQSLIPTIASTRVDAIAAQVQTKMLAKAQAALAAGNGTTQALPEAAGNGTTQALPEPTTQAPGAEPSTTPTSAPAATTTQERGKKR